MIKLHILERITKKSYKHHFTCTGTFATPLAKPLGVIYLSQTITQTHIPIYI